MKNTHWILAFAFLALAVGVGAQDRPDVVLADFEAADYGEWSATGEAFGTGPATGALDRQMQVVGYRGERLVNSFLRGDGTRGTLTSPYFDINRKYITFLIGGGNHPHKACLNLLVDGEVVRTATGRNDEHLELGFWDVSALQGKPARLQIVDQVTGDWGHINVDHIVLTDKKPDIPVERDRLLERANRAVADAAGRAATDPRRPAYHFLPAAQWMNDPNGTIFHDGYYHVFFQHNPYGDRWGNMHWGHARSRDLVHWERLPIALWPSKGRGEDHVFSGCAWKSGAGDVLLFYTSVGSGRPNEQWAAVPLAADLLEWRKHPKNPLITTKRADGPDFGAGMRDPFIFEAGGKTLMVVGADTEDEAVVPVYEAADETLGAWKYRGILWRTPKTVMKFPECPNFFPLGEKFILLTSPYRPVEYRVGTLDLDSFRFSAETEGRLDHSQQYYATNIAFDDAERCVLFGWIRGFPSGHGWNGCLALPRVLTLGDDGHPRQTPVPELQKLRENHRRLEAVPLKSGTTRVEGVKGDTVELLASFDPGTASRVGLRVRCSPDGSAAKEIAFDRMTITAAGEAFPFKLGPDEDTLTLHVFVDRSVLEVFINERACVTRVLDSDPAHLGVEVFATGGEATLRSLDVWTIRGIW